jgi:hypothetical protein
MSIVVEDGTGLASAESYPSVVYADAYHASYGNDAWAALTTTQKEVCLRKATRYIDTNYVFRGVKKYLAQGLEFPRHGYADYEQWPERDVLQACCELALRASEDDLQQDSEDQVVIREVIGPLRTDYAYKGMQVRYAVVDRLLQRFISTGGGSVRIELTG